MNARTVPRIMVAEDDADLRGVLVRMLQRDNHQVVGVEGAAALVEEVKRTMAQEPRPAALIIADLRLGDLEVLPVLEDLRGQKGSLAFILISGAWTAEQQDRARALGALALLSKPFHFRHLRQLVRKFERERGEWGGQGGDP